MGVHGEAAVDKTNESGHDVADVNRLPMVALRDVEDRRRHDFLPTKAHVCTEDSDGGKVEQAPTQRLEDFELHAVNITDWDCITFVFAFNPESSSANPRWS